MSAAPETWGPSLWRVFHCLADASTRQDVVLLWGSLIRLTYDALPCQKCREHMRAYWAAHTIVPKGWNHMDAAAIQTHFRQKMSDFHNDVNVRLGKPVVPLELTPLSCGEAMRIVTEEWGHLRRMWDVLAPSIPAYFEWRSTMTRLIQLAACGS
jgi:hypothetical protein